MCFSACILVVRFLEDVRLEPLSQSGGQILTNTSRVMCQNVLSVNSTVNQTQPVIHTPLSEHPWEVIGIDLLENGEIT